MERITAIDEKLTAVFGGFEAIAKDMQMPVICDLSDEATIALQTYSGLYRIDIATPGPEMDLEEWISDFRADWELDRYKKSFTPSLKKKRIKSHSMLKEWMPFYLGKSKNVASRVLEHINLAMEKPTFALKLKARPEMAQRRFRLCTLPLPVVNYDIIVPMMEASLRDQLGPLIGKQ